MLSPYFEKKNIIDIIFVWLNALEISIQKMLLRIKH